MSEFAEKFPRTFKKWKKHSGFLICLAVKDATELNDLRSTLLKNKIKFIDFFEPDVNQITAIAIAPSSEADYITRRIRLAGNKTGVFDKHHLIAV